MLMNVLVETSSSSSSSSSSTFSSFLFLVAFTSFYITAITPDVDRRKFQIGEWSLYESR